MTYFEHLRNLGCLEELLQLGKDARKIQDSYPDTYDRICYDCGKQAPPETRVRRNYVGEGLNLCQDCAKKWDEKVGPRKCFVCGEALGPKDLQYVTGEEQYHLDCFFESRNR
jgi:hypothetical protein